MRTAAAGGAGGAHFNGNFLKDGQQRFGAKRGVIRSGERADGDLLHAVPALLHHFHVGLDHGIALLAEFLHVLLVHDFEELLASDAKLVKQAGDGEECAEECVALHAQLKVGAVGGLAGNVKAGQRVHANVVVDDLLARPLGQVLPGALAFGVTLPDERAAGLHAVERVAVGEGLGIAAQNCGHVAQVAVDPDALLGGDHEVAGGRAFFLRTVLGVGGDVDDFLGIAVLVHDLVAFVKEVVEVANNGAEVFAGGDGAPAAYGVEADGDGGLREQRRAVFGDDGVGVGNAEDDEAGAVGGGVAVRAGAAGSGELKCSDNVLGAEVAGAQAVSAADDARNFSELDFRAGRRFPARLWRARCGCRGPAGCRG